MVSLAIAFFVSAAVTEPVASPPVSPAAATEPASLYSEAVTPAADSVTSPAAVPATEATAALAATEAVGAPVTTVAGPVINYAGRVLERGTRRPIADAQVVIADLGLTAITGPEGFFEFEDVPAGRYDIVVPLVGFQRYKTWEEISEAERIDVVYYLEPDYGSPLEVVVEADKVKKEVT
jgi:hypothetical protein